MNDASTFQQTLDETRRVLADVERAVASLGELPADLAVSLDLDTWADNLAVRDAAPVLPPASWFLRG